MDSNLTKFLKDLDKEISIAEKSLDDRIKGTGEAIQDSLMAPKANQGTPKITGHLRANWIVTIDQEYLDVAGSQENVDKSIRDSKWGEFLNYTELYLKNNLYWNNNVWYGPLVNYGTDKIPAQKFREKAIQDGNEYLKANRTTKK